MATASFPDSGALIYLVGSCCDSALDAGVAEDREKGNIFSPQRSLKAKDSLLSYIALIGPRSYIEPWRRPLRLAGRSSARSSTHRRARQGGGRPRYSSTSTMTTKTS